MRIIDIKIPLTGKKFYPNQTEIINESILKFIVEVTLDIPLAQLLFLEIIGYKPSDTFRVLGYPPTLQQVGNRCITYINDILANEIWKTDIIEMDAIFDTDTRLLTGTLILNKVNKFHL